MRQKQLIGNSEEQKEKTKQIIGQYELPGEDMEENKEEEKKENQYAQYKSQPVANTGF